VEENIQTGLEPADAPHARRDLRLFPVLFDMRRRKGGNLSGGSSSSWRSRARWRPTQGAAARRADRRHPAFHHQGHRQGAERDPQARDITIVVSEQVLSFALDVADRLFVIEGGRFVHETQREHRRRAHPRLPVRLRSRRLPTAAIQEQPCRYPDQGRSGPIAYDNPQVHNRWHPDIPMACWVKPGDDFILETYDWTGGFIKNNDSADDVRDIDLSTVHFLSGPVGVQGAEPGDLLVVDLLDIGAKDDSQWGFNGFFSKQNGGGFLTDHFRWRRSRSGTSTACSPVAPHPGRELRRPDPPGPDRLPARPAMLDVEQREPA
jgi:hypothetical protein